MATEPEAKLQTLPTFGVKPYQPDNGSTLGAMFGMLLVLSISGMILGFVASFIGQYLYLILVFPLVIGMLQGAIGARMAQKLHVRGLMVGAVAGLIGGLLAMFMMHYFDYQRFKTEMGKAKVAPEVMALAKMSPEQSSRLINSTEMDATDKEDLWQAIKLLRVQSMLDYMNLEAERGVQIKPGHGDTKGANLGYTGSWIYWILEALIVAAITLVVIKGQTTQPYCPRCHLWKTETLLGRWNADPKPLRQAVSSGDLTAIRAALVGNPQAGFNIHVSMATCDQCRENGPVDVKLESVVYDKKGKENKTKMTHVTFPPEAVTHLVGLFVPPVSPSAGEENKAEVEGKVG